MSNQLTLAEAYQRASYPVLGNGKRNIQVLKDALEEVDGSMDSDMYGKGFVIEDFQQRMAEVLGKESAVFFPSGTMAQQIALRIWCDQQGTKRVAYHPLCHLEIHEQDGLKELHQIDPILLGERDRLIRMDDIQGLNEDIACLLLELPQREIGGQLPAYEELEEIAAYCHAKGIKLHLDGARLFEILPYYKKSAAEICALFDSVYISFYKGIGGIAGAILAGDSAFTAESKIWKRRHGGDLISLYPYIISSDYYYQQRIGKMESYYEHAKQLAAMYNACPGIETKPQEPVSNMFHVHIALPKEQVEAVLVDLYQETGIGLTSYVNEASEHSTFFEVSIGDRYEKLPQDLVKQALERLHEKMVEQLQR